MDSWFHMTDFPPRDPSLEIRPVPHKRSFNNRSVGPGADPAIQKTARHLNDVDLDIRPTDYSVEPEFDSQMFERERPFNRWVRDDEDWFGYKKRSDDVRKLLSAVEAHQIKTRGPLGQAATDPTWGYFVFVTSYSNLACQKLNQALENLVQATIRSLRLMSPSLYSEEATKRFKLEVIEDKEALENASEDRVREEFRAHLRSLGVLEEDLMFRGIGISRFSACILLDEQTISRLANCSFSLDIERDEPRLADVLVRMIDPKWDYPAEPYPGELDDEDRPYRGGDYCPVTALAELYRIMDGNLMGEYPFL
ncbi:hypothetical protein FVEG_04996 [Fusarium verticillioides 7600]|uniref:Uncharacterized protein n=1 Tax=Gibberella moniliformis (strain M3125 / FGSC 7600) TaxID=334819 RepID=W7M7J8_GIBM7|nr:hypothetical protein FVEG_04996 [Fusarium verticillioides 7600]EWG43580.1 hypothetical protein FVEG_04996 [Fusarium verticillioides 7600]